MGGHGGITVFLADDSAIIRAGRERDAAARPRRRGRRGRRGLRLARRRRRGGQPRRDRERHPHAAPLHSRKGIDACKEIRKRHPGTGVVILSQYDDPDYAVSLLAEGSAGYAYLLKDRIAEGDQLGRAIREVATGGSMLDPVIVSALLNPVRRTGGLSTEDDELLEMVAAGRTIKSIASLLHTTPAVDRRPCRATVRQARRGRIERAGRGARPPAPSAPGDRRARGAGREPQPPAPHGRRRAVDRRRPRGRRDRNGSTSRS